MRITNWRSWHLLMLLRLVLPFLVVALAIAPQQAAQKAAEDEADVAEWEGDEHAWHLNDGVSQGALLAPRLLFWFFAAVNSATSNALRGSGSPRRRSDQDAWPWPPGVALEINSATVEWFTNSLSALVVLNNRPSEWKAYRVVVEKGRFRMWQNGIPAALDLAVSHSDPKGNLSLHLSESGPSDVALRRIRIKE